jgi:hypothetical protein
MRVLCVMVSILLVSTALQARSVQLITDHIGSSPKMIAVGNIEGIYSGPMSVLDNPAGIVSDTLKIGFMTTQLSDDQSTFYQAGVTVPWLSGNIGFGVINLSSQNLDKTAETQGGRYFSESTFGTYERLFTVAYAQPLQKGMSIGAAVKFFDQNLYESRGSGYNMDIGAVWEESDKKFTVGVKNIFPNLKVKYSNNQNELNFPLQLVAGTRWDISGIGVLGQLKYIPESKVLLKSVGLDYIDSIGLSLHAGWKEVLANQTVHNTYGCGLGVSWNQLAIQAGYELSEFMEQNARQYIQIEVSI